VWPEFGLRLTRDFSFDATGDFVVKKTFDKVHGEARLHSLWSVVHVQPIVTITAAKPRSPYRDGFHWILPTSQTNLVQRLSPSLLQVSPGDQQSFKIGVDAPVAALVAVKGKQSVRIRAARGSGEYPDGALGAGFPVELYGTGGHDARWHHVELELLSPLRPSSLGPRWSHTMRWSLHSLPSSNWKTPAVHRAVERLLNFG
jgi:hypothetical protein